MKTSREEKERRKIASVGSIQSQGWGQEVQGRGDRRDYFVTVPSDHLLWNECFTSSHSHVLNPQSSVGCYLEALGGDGCRRDPQGGVS